MSDQSMPISGPPSCPNGFLYTIQPGDTYFLLAQRFGTTVAAIQAAKPGVDPKNLQIGQVVCVPVSAPPPSCPNGFYTIQPGDTYFAGATLWDHGCGDPGGQPGVDPNNCRSARLSVFPLHRRRSA